MTVDDLQWGHRLSAMETGLPAAPAAIRDLPSMGPPPFGDGNETAISPAASMNASLQWGHRLSAMET